MTRPDRFHPNRIFVFGSNTAGIHGKGAALHAARYYGARRGVWHGPTGRAFAIPTRIWINGAHGHRIETMSLEAIRPYVRLFIEYASSHPEMTFEVTPIGTGLAGYSHEQIAPMFKGAPDNCILPKEWLAHA